jgi:lipopolysaccharide export system permease protein
MFQPFIFYRYFLREHIGPFLFALFLIVFLFLTNFTIREANSLFGRGLDTMIIIQLFYYNLAPMMALSVPMSVFVAVAMACSRLAADSEITILRSSGVSLIRILLPLILAAISIAIAMFYFNNTILPEYNVKSSVLMREISRLKPTVNLYPNTFTEIKNVQLYVRDIDDKFSENKEQKIIYFM